MRLFTLLIAFGAILIAFPVNALTFSVSSTPQTVATGSEVTVDIRVEDFTDVTGYQFSMSWDPAVLEFLSVVPKLPGMSASGHFNTANAANGTLAHLYPAQGIGAFSLPDGSILFTLRFLAVGVAGASSPISFTAVPTPIAAYNGGLQPLTVVAPAGLVNIATQDGFSVSGTVNRTNGMPVPAVLAAMSGDATGTDLTGAAGDYGFANLPPGSDLTITPARTADPLECVSVRDILFIYKHFLGIEPLPNPYAMVAADANQSHSITSSDPVELRKLILGIYTELPNAPSWQFIPADYVFPNPLNPFSQQFPEDATITDLQANAVRNFTAVKTGDVTDCTGDVQGPAFLTTLASNANGQPGQQVTVDVTVQDFADVTGLQFSMQWNPAVAQFDGLTNFGLPGLDNAAFNTAQAAAGKLSVCWWTDMLLGSQTLPNNTLLFTLTFTLVGPAGSSTPVAFVQMPTQFEVVNGDCAPFGLSTGNGLIVVSDQPPPPTAFQLVSGNATSANYAPVCAPVTASNFSDLTSVQFSLGWDQAVFEYLQVQNFNQLAGLSSANVDAGQSGNGLLAFSWSDPNAIGVSLPNGTVLFEVCFTPVGPPGASTPFGFPGSPVPAEAVDANGDPVPLQTTSGTLNISTINISAPVTVFVSPTPQTVATGSEVTVDIRVEDFTDVAGYQFSMGWDPAVLQFLAVVPKLPGMGAGVNFNTANNAAGVLTHLFFKDGPGTLSLPDGSVLFTLKFLAVGAAGTSSPISFGGVPTPIAVYNGGLQPLTMTVLEGIVHIAAQGGFSVSGTLARANGTPMPDVLVAMTGDATGSDLTGAPGDYLFENLTAGSNLALAPTKTADPLECVSVRDILFISKHILGLTPLSDPYRMVAADANQSGGITTFDNVELRKLILGIYPALPNNQSWRFIPSDFVFSNPLNPFQDNFPETATITDLQADAVRDFVAVKVGDATDCAGDTPGTAFLTTLASSANGQPGQQVTIDVTVQGFSDVSGVQFSMEWDPAVAQFTGVGNFNLPGLDAANFHTNPAGMSFCWWTDVLAGGRTLPNGSVLFSLTFTLVGQPGSSTPVVFVQTPTKFEVVDGNCDPFGLNVAGGQISVVAQPPANPVQLIAASATSFGGAPICVPVSTANFTDVVAAQFSLAWDPAKFTFQQVQNSNSPLGLNNSNLLTAQAGNGVLGFSWYDPNVVGVTLPANSVLFEVCFEPVGPVGTSSTLNFSSTPVPVEILHANGNPLPVQAVGGTLTIAPAGANDPVLFTVSPTPQTVASGQAVTVQIQVSDFTDMAGYQFSMSWDPAVLQLQSVTPALPGISVAGNFNIGNAAAGTLTHLFFVQDQTPLTLPDDSALFSLNFIAVGAAGTSSLISFGGTPTPIAAYNTGLQAVPVATLPGIVYIAAQAGLSVSGNISRISGPPVPDVLVAMTGDATGTDLTDLPGDYLFENLAAGSNLALTPFKNTGPLECVSVRDLLFISKHILGIMPLPNSYRRVAADANRSGSITTFDNVELRKLILGIYTALPNNQSWRFIPADYVFPNPLNPFSQQFPETATVTDLQADAVRDFVAVKVGDVTDCVGDEHGPAFLTTLASSAVGITGQQVTIDVTVQGFTDVSGLQFSMEWDPAVAQFAGVGNFNLPGLSALAFNTNQAGTGKLSLCWNTDVLAGGQTLPDGSVLFSLTFTLVGPGGSSTPVAFVETPTRFEVVDGNCDPFGLNSSNGLITISGQPMPTQLLASSATSFGGAPVCSQISMNGFSEIIAAQFTVAWDPSKFSFQQLKGFNPALGLSSGGNFSTAQAGNGLLLFSWIDPQALGVTLPNTPVLFEVCFTPVGPVGAVSSVSFPNLPQHPVEIVKEPGGPLPVQTINGALTIAAASLPCGITCPSGVPALTANSSCQAVLGDYTGLAVLSGDCIAPVVQIPAPGTVVNPGTVAVTLTASDAAGQSATCVFNVAVGGGCGGGN
ncbi:MAG: hypothetical protein IPM98_03975 [Lewinellaceae bacterium]|nr:hypothetical protein [Lewinellaceae bacterium]